MNIAVLAVVAILYLGAIVYLGFRGYRATSSTADYMLAGRKAHPFVMALSYGAAFISTSAIVGFGGAASVFGMGILWLVVLNIFVGIFIAFAVLGRRTRRMGHRLQAHTFPELLGKRFQSRFMQAFCALIIMLFMPLYAAAVLIAASRYIETTFDIPYGVAVTIFSILIAGYVVAGGLKGVMYADALQGTIMFAGMFVLIIFAYGRMGGIIDAHEKLAQLPNEVRERSEEVLPDLHEIAPADARGSDAWQWLAGQAGTLRASAALTDEEREAMLTEDPALASAAAFLKEHPAAASRLALTGLESRGFRGWTRMPETGSYFFYTLVTSIIMGVGIGVLAQPQLVVRFMTVRSGRQLNQAILVGGIFILFLVGVSFVAGNLSNVWFFRLENGGAISVASVPGGNIDLVIPKFINSALPAWFGALFMLTLMSAALSTLSSQFHAIGTAIGRDLFGAGLMGRHDHERTVLVTRCGVIIAIVATVILAFNLPPGIVAVATAVFFGLCAAAFLPMYLGALYWRRMSRAAALSSLLVGFGVSFFWLMFVQQIKGHPAVLAPFVFGRDSLLPEPVLGVHWNWLEALFVALPASAIVAVVMGLATKTQSPQHTAFCFGDKQQPDSAPAEHRTAAQPALRADAD